ncbi:polymorphic toxin-type HINT domain-containing protein [Amycolatopsis sp. OK19-0408]|uniref:Polymorphic toxin-type HINT domain-containing protein n=1 Tax=Amycolatopsis iheyensis TaxID=2945988 RepID=A0A9X2N9Q1_9PSEU|nr:polymorphic toxin-type HINT domain-containing protein [Amycolatopsis iheyensis]MCR6483213.1 polymorphic toxin-type HINT domain-containing protein [Amycolatopsis iheyensis]
MFARRESGRAAFGLLLLVVALFAGMLTAPAALADTGPPDTPALPMTDRDRVVQLWRLGGSTVKADAAAALVGTDADITAFLNVKLPQDRKVDDRISVNRILASGGPTVKTAAQQALDATDDAAISTFLASGWKLPSSQDRRIRVDQMLAVGGPEMQKAAQAALDADTDDALQDFLDTGWKQPYALDQRIRVDQALATGGPETRAAAQRALDADTTEAYAQFLNHDREIAEARDLETSTIAQLAGAAKDAGEEAARETQASKDASARAVTEAQLAKQAAEAAATASANAHNDANAATAAAVAAADAADKAASAAREAVGAANAASVAARVASGAATRAATAATKAGQAASQAYNSASAAATDAKNADTARQAAETARDAAQGARDAAAAARSAGDAVIAAKNAISAAGSAGTNAAAAARAAEAASKNSSVARAEATKARQAAASAAANAARATRAAQAASAFADTAATAAYAAQAAAERAARDADAAAAAALDAANHAHNATEAATLATTHANAATQAAQAAINAATQAKTVYDAARTADAARLAAETERDDELALHLGAAADQVSVADRWNKTQNDLRTAETNRLITEATAAGTDPALALADARKAALALATSGGPWTQAAAQTALASPDVVAIDFIRTGLALAAGQDDRVTLANLARTGTDGFKAAADAALAGSDADVQAFLHSQDYPNRELDDRIAVDRILADAQQAGNFATQAAAQRALDADTDQALRQFLDADKTTSAILDDRIKANQILAADTSGPQLKAAAQIALDGTPAMVRDFLVSGQYSAAQQDQDSAAHDAQVSGYLAQAMQTAQSAAQSADLAQKVAATARGAAAEAAGYAQQAETDRQQAAASAQQAHESALAAQDAATRAARSAATANTAAVNAQKSSRSAAMSAAWANSSANFAARMASDAYGSARDAFKSALAAGDSVEKAKTAANDAVSAALATVKRKQEEANGILLLHCKSLPGGIGYDECIQFAQMSDADKAMRVLSNDWLCRHTENMGRGFQQQCFAAETSPTFATDLAFTAAAQALNELGAIYGALATTETALLAGTLCAAFEPCGLLAASIVPEGTAFTSWMAIATGDALVASRVGGLLENELVEQRASGPNFLNEFGKPFTACTPNSFTGDTPVLLAGGGTKPIKNVVVGDWVLAADAHDGRPVPEPVTRLITGEGQKSLVNVVVRARDSVTRIEATSNHPFWVQNLVRWVEAKDLRRGDHLRTPTGEAVVGSDVHEHEEQTKVYNLTVANLHTYFVGSKMDSALVHNADCVIDPRKLDYLFNVNIKADDHNSARAQQNMMELLKIGIKDTSEMRAYIAEELRAAPARGFDHTYTNEFGEFGVAYSVLYGPYGIRSVESSWQILPDGTYRFSSAIFRHRK